MMVVMILIGSVLLAPAVATVSTMCIAVAVAAATMPPARVAWFSAFAFKKLITQYKFYIILLYFLFYIGSIGYLKEVKYE